MSESAKYRHLVHAYLTGNGVDIASGGWPIVPHAIQIELPQEKFKWYNQRDLPADIEWKGDARDLPFKDKTLDFVFSSHFLEDVFEWLPVLTEWQRVLKVGGFMVILVPDKKLWNEAIARGQPCNSEHRHESRPGELTEVFQKHFGHFEIQKDQLTALDEFDYTVMFVAKRLR